MPPGRAAGSSSIQSLLLWDRQYLPFPLYILWCSGSPTPRHRAQRSFTEGTEFVAATCPGAAQPGSPRPGPGCLQQAPSPGDHPCPCPSPGPLCQVPPETQQGTPNAAHVPWCHPTMNLVSRMSLVTQPQALMSLPHHTPS